LELRKHQVFVTPQEEATRFLRLPDRLTHFKQATHTFHLKCSY